MKTKLAEFSTQLSAGFVDNDTNTEGIINARWKLMELSLDYLIKSCSEDLNLHNKISIKINKLLSNKIDYALVPNSIRY